MSRMLSLAALLAGIACLSSEAAAQFGKGGGVDIASSAPVLPMLIGIRIVEQLLMNTQDIRVCAYC